MSSFSFNAAPRFTAEQVGSFSTKQLGQLVSYIPGQSATTDSEVVQFLKNLQIWGSNLYFSERIIVKNVALDPARDRQKCIKPDDYTKDTGTTIVYQSDKFSVEDTKESKIYNAPIPSEAPLRAGCSALSVFLSMIVDNAGGKWVPRGNVADFQKVYLQLELVTIKSVAISVCENMNAEKVWTTMPLTKRQAITKEHSLKYMVEYLMRMTLVDYLILHCTVVYDCFTVYQKVQVGYRAREQKHDTTQGGVEPKFVSASGALPFYQALTPDEKRVVLERTNRAPPRLYLGGAGLPIELGRTSNATELNKLIQLRTAIGADSVGPFLLYTMKGYSGMVSDTGKRIQLLCSLAMGQFAAEKPVDIHVESSGDVSVLVNSLTHCVSSMGLKWTVKDGSYFRIILPSSSLIKAAGFDLYTSDVARAETVIIVPGKEKGTEEHSVPVTQIYFSSNNTPTSSKKGEAIDWEFESSRYLRVRAKNWIYCGPIFGNYMFGSDLDQAPTTSTAVIDKPPFRSSIAYGFGDGSNFKGVLSNKAIDFYGLEPQEDPNSISRKFLPTKIEFPMFHTPAQWYGHVHMENGRKLSSWLNPITRYSPISNTFRQSKKGALQSSAEVLVEKGELTEQEAKILFGVGEAVVGAGEVMDESSIGSFQATNSSLPLQVTTAVTSSPSSSSQPIAPVLGEVFTE